MQNKFSQLVLQVKFKIFYLINIHLIFLLLLISFMLLGSNHALATNVHAKKSGIKNNTKVFLTP